jgi:hypothetical protein
MARTRTSAETKAVSLHRTLSTPRRALVNMLVFLILVGVLAAIVLPQMKAALLTNPFLNGLILFVLLMGVFYCFAQVLRLYPEIRWVNGFRIADPGIAAGSQPKLLAPMATMLRDRTGALSLSATSMRSIMDSIGARLDEARDTGRYLVGLLVFLGLLGTFWGLLETISSVGKAIGSLDTKAGEANVMFEELKAGLAAPLQGMGTAFSASLLGLAGSLVLGFLELQASHAQNRFYNELEEWLSGITELTPGGQAGNSEAVTRQLAATLYDLQRIMGDLNMRLNDPARVHDPAIAELAKGINELAVQMRAEQSAVRGWIDEQSTQQAEVANVLRALNKAISPGSPPPAALPPKR